MVFPKKGSLFSRVTEQLRCCFNRGWSFGVRNIDQPPYMEHSRNSLGLQNPLDVGQLISLPFSKMMTLVKITLLG